MSKQKLPEPNLKPEDLKPGDVLLFPPNPMPEGWVGQAIVLLTKGTVSHTALFCGEVGGVMMVAHAAPGGIVSLPFAGLVSSEPGCFVMRHTEKTDLYPVLKAIDGYADHENPYPFFNLGILGLLLLANCFSEKTLRNRIFYDLALLVSVKLMKAVEKHRFPDKKPMSCSQFAAQCYTDAGKEYDIRFDKLLIQFGELNAVDSQTSLLGLLNVGDMPEVPEMSINRDYTPDEEMEIAIRFIEWMSGDGKNKLTEASELVNEKDLNKVGRRLLTILCQAFTNTRPSSVKEAVELLATNRNYFVTPEDLFVNTLNLKNTGYIDRTVL